MNKEQQIEELHDFILNNLYKGSTHLLAEKLYNAGYGNVSEYKAERELLGSQIKVLKQRLNNKCIEVYNLNRDYTNSFERLKAQEREIERLKAENCELTKKLEARLTCDFVKTAQKKAVKKFAEKLKGKLHDFGDGGEKGAYITEKDIDELITEAEGINNDH